MPIPGERLRLLATLLAAPEPDSLAILEELAPEHPWLAEAAAELRSVPIEEWQAEHGRLFICGYPRTPCLPFESAHRHGMMCGPATEELAMLYLDLGLQADELPPDYLGIELECAAHLAEAGGHPEAERALWQDHLLRWLPEYADVLARESRLVLYGGLANELAAICREAGHA